MSAREDTLPKGLVIGILILTLVVLALGGAVIAVRLRPEPLPENSVDRNVALWQRAVDENPEDALAYTGLGVALIEAGRTDEAQVALEKALTLDEDLWATKFRLGQLVEDADPERASRLYSDAAKLAPDQEKVGPLIAYGELALEGGDPKGARNAFKRSLIYDPFTFDGHLGLAKAHEALGNDAAALDEYREADRFAPGSAEVTEAIERLGG